MAIYYERGSVTFKGKPNGSDVAGFHASLPVIAKGKPGGTDTSAMVNAGAAAIARGIPGGTGGVRMAESGLVTAFGVPGGSDRARMKESSAAPIGLGVVSGHDTFLIRSAVPVTARGIPSVSDVATMVDHSPISGRGVPGGHDVAAMHETTTAQGFGIAGGTQKVQRFRETTLALALGIPGGTDTRSAVGSSTVRAKGIPSGQDAQAMHETGLVIFKGKPSGSNSPDPNTMRNLVSAVRANAKATFTECVKGDQNLLQFPEVLPTRKIAPADLPFLVLLFGEPQPDQWAVNQVVQVVQCDVLYVTKLVRDGATDTPQYARFRLGTFEQMMLQDQRQKGGTTAPACNRTRLMATSLQRQNQYQQAIATDGENLVVMLSTFEFTLVNDRIAV